MTQDISELAALVGRTGYLSYGKLDFPVVILGVKVGGWNRVLVEVTPFEGDPESRRKIGLEEAETRRHDVHEVEAGLVDRGFFPARSSESKELDSIRGLD